MTAAGQNQQKAAYFPVCVLKLGINFQVAVSASIWRESQKPTTRCHCILLRQKLSRLWATTNPKEPTLHPSEWCTNCRTSPTSPAPLPCIQSQCKFFQSNLHLSCPNLLYKSARQFQDSGRGVVSIQPRCGGFRLQTPAPGPLSG